MSQKAYYIFAFLLLIFACKEGEDDVLYDDTPFVVDTRHFPEPNWPEDNALTIAGVTLGKMLFFDPVLSKDGTQSCASCHHQPDGFSDTLQFSLGVRGLPGRRQAMGIFNMAWNTNGFFWDGRAELLRHQSLLPIEDSLEMDETLENVVNKLSDQSMYTDQFKRAFGDPIITPERMSLAMEQFMLTIVSNDSKYDRYLNQTTTLTESEERGRALYFGEFNPFFPDVSGADCQHCHGGLNFENDSYINNGLDLDPEFSDFGLEEVTGSAQDRAKFKVPSLRNIAVTPPYMHDGRFATLEEVIDHYDHGLKMSSTVDPALLQVIDHPTGLMLTETDKTDLINFLHTLTDDTFLNNPDYQDPF